MHYEIHKPFDNVRQDQEASNPAIANCSSPRAKPSLEEIIAPPNSIKSRVAMTEGGSVNGEDDNASEDL